MFLAFQPPTVHPINMVTEGSSMTILCIAVGAPTPTVSLYISGNYLFFQTVIELKFINNYFQAA